MHNHNDSLYVRTYGRFKVSQVAIECRKRIDQRDDVSRTIIQQYLYNIIMENMSGRIMYVKLFYVINKVEKRYTVCKWAV